MGARAHSARYCRPPCYEQVADQACRAVPNLRAATNAVETALNCACWRNCELEMECGALAAELARRMGGRFR